MGQVDVSKGDFNEKRKWQIALRRYVLKQNNSSTYAPYFGISVEGFRAWIETQFIDMLGWNNFSTDWQFEHVVPVAFFDLSNTEHLKLCWNFTNISIEPLVKAHHKAMGFNKQAARRFFETLYMESGLPICRYMIDHIDTLDEPSIEANANQSIFLREQKDYLNRIAGFNSYMFQQLNNGISVGEIIAERDLLSRFG